MPRQTEFERRIAAIDELVQRLETAADPATRAASQELVRALMELHGAALERMLARSGRNGAAGGTIVDQLARDEVVASVLLLYDLHPVDLETRVRGALEKSRPYLKSHGGNVELVAIDEPGHRAAPDAGELPRLPVLGRDAQARHRAGDPRGGARRDRHPRRGPDRVGPSGRARAGQPAVQRQANGHGEVDAAWQDVPELGRLANGATRRVEVGGRDVLFCRLEETLYAYGARCPAMRRRSRRRRRSTGRALSCSGCGQGYDIVQAGRAPDRPELHLDPFPILTRNGRTQVALPRAAGSRPHRPDHELAGYRARRRVRAAPAVRQDAGAGGAVRPVRPGGRPRRTTI